ncbi:MAG: class I SAM-dependent methyltransferase, partial [Verrucomicrobiota bacterium]|nr:class I SAM-dependent methyltransferase [Verrucomicrobiota bacterium]
MNLSSLDSKPLTQCQICGCSHLDSILFLGYVPPVNEMLTVGGVPNVEMRFPLELMRCKQCTLVQIGYEVDPRILFPHSYPYLSGTTKILRENFKNLAQESNALFHLSQSDLIIDIGANDGTLLAPFRDLGAKVLGIEPSQAADVARTKGIEMVKDYFSQKTAQQVRAHYGSAKIITAANVFAHIKNVHEIIEGILHLLSSDGVFISESHYLLDLVQTLQYDTIYHEHLRYYALGSLMKLFEQHGLEIFRVKRIATHGGSIRVYAARKGQFPIHTSVTQSLKEEDEAGLTDGACFRTFRQRVIQSKLDLISLITDIKAQGRRIYGIGAPSRASTLINYVGLDDGLIDAVMEVAGSHKLNKYIPGTRVPVLDEQKLYQDQPEYV